MAKLILTSDDYGLKPSINAGILEAVRNRLLTSVHVMVNHATEDDILKLVEAVKEGGNMCGIGLHFCTLTGQALKASSPRMVNSEYGVFHDIDHWQYHEEDDHQMAHEMEEQYRLLSEILGGPDKIDAFSSHYNIHLFDETYNRIMINLGIAHHIPIRSAVRWNQEQNRDYPEKLWPLNKAGIKTLLRCNPHSRKVLFAASSGEDMKSRRDEANAGSTFQNRRAPDSSSGHWFGQPSKFAIEWIVQQLSEIHSDFPSYSTEIFMHLANSTVGQDETVFYSLAERLEEYQVLMKEDVKNLIHSLYDHPQIELGSYRKVLQGKTIQF